MSIFSEEALVKKLLELDTTQHSIQTLSLWLIHHRKHRAVIVAIWFRELLKAKDSRKLIFMYLANDVIQTSRKKGPEYCQEFDKVLQQAFESLTLDQYDEKTCRNIRRILKIWADRNVYTSQRILAFKQALGLDLFSPLLETSAPVRGSKLITYKPTSIKAKLSSPPPDGLESSDPSASDPANAQRRTRKSMEGAKENVGPHVENVVRSGQEIAEMLGLVKLLKNPASIDSDTQLKIDTLSDELFSDASDFEYGGIEEAQAVELKATSLLSQLNDYNKRLSKEILLHTKLLSILETFTMHHETSMKERQLKLDEKDWWFVCKQSIG